MYNYEIDFINRMIRSNSAYVVHVPQKGQFVCCKSEDERQKQCIKHLDQSFLQNENDFVIWRSTDEGFETQWGTGLPTANFFVLCLYSRK